MTETRTLQERLAQFAGDARVTIFNGSAGQLLMTAGALTAEAVTALDAKDALLREAREDVGLLIKQLTKIQENAQRSGELLYHPKSPMAEQIDKISALLIKLNEASK